MKILIATILALTSFEAQAAPVLKNGQLFAGDEPIQTYCKKYNFPLVEEAIQQEGSLEKLRSLIMQNTSNSTGMGSGNKEMCTAADVALQGYENKFMGARNIYAKLSGHLSGLLNKKENKDLSRCIEALNLSEKDKNTLEQNNCALAKGCPTSKLVGANAKAYCAKLPPTPK